MTHTRQALDNLTAIARHIGHTRLPEKSESAKAVEALNASDLALAAPPEAALEQVRNRLVAASRTGDFSALRRDLRDAAWLLWTNDRPLARLPGLLNAVWAQAHRSNATARALIEGMAEDIFARDGAVAREGISIRQYLLLQSNPRLEFWRRVDRRVELFSAERGPHNLADWLIARARAGRGNSGGDRLLRSVPSGRRLYARGPTRTDVERRPTH